MQMWALSTTVGIITLLLVSVGRLAGHLALLLVALLHLYRKTGHVAGLLVWLTY